ncbi:MAG: ParB/RepB/Spo0J family partition protein [Nitrospirota bacterium]
MKKESSFMERYKKPSLLNLAGIQGDGTSISEGTQPDYDTLLISTSKLIANPNQPRKEFGPLDELVRSIEDKGVLEPLLVCKREEGFLILAGERRFRAAQKAGLTELPCRVLNVSEEEALEIALVENLQREDLSILNEAMAMKELKAKGNRTIDDLSKFLGKSTGYISTRLAIADLPSDLKALIEKEPDRIPKAVLAKIVREKDPEKQKELLKKGLVGKSPSPGRPVKAYKWRNRKNGFDLLIYFRSNPAEAEELLKILQKASDEIQRCQNTEILRKMKEEMPQSSRREDS